MITDKGKNYYSIEEIKAYIHSKDSLGDVAYFLNDKNIQLANAKTVIEEDELNGNIYPGHEMYD